MKSKFAKKTLAALVLAAAVTSVASVPVFAEEVNAVAETEKETEKGT